jgi:tetratricopeptide (TPR) repeat protein
MDNDDQNQQYIIDLVKENKYETAINEFKKYITTNPQSASANYNIAVIYDFLKEYDKAIDYYNTACKYDTKYLKVKSECEERIRNLELLRQ